MSGRVFLGWYLEIYNGQYCPNCINLPQLYKGYGCCDITSSLPRLICLIPVLLVYKTLPSESNDEIDSLKIYHNTGISNTGSSVTAMYLSWWSHSTRWYFRLSQDDIFDYHPLRECNFYFIIPNRTLNPLFSLRPTMLRGVPKGKNEWKCIFDKNGSFLTIWMLKLITDVQLNKLRHNSWWHQT